MSNDAYTLKQKQGTDEYHLFLGKMKDDGGCTSKATSICNKMKKANSAGNIFSCKDEDSARTLCAKYGRQVCGTCVSHLYETY